MTERNDSSAEFHEPFRLVGRPKPGQILFGRYRVEKAIGEGGMGSVWLVHNLAEKVDRALKLIVAEIAGDPQIRARFKREARVMARLRHRNAVAVYETRLGDDGAFIEMEYIHGRSLKERLNGLPMPMNAVVNILEQLCGVLQAAHNLGIVHRDLKPSNLMILDSSHSSRDLLKVLDFGIAKILRAEEDHADEVQTQANFFLGTPHYSSPEQIQGAEIDVSSDIYSVGVILYEMLVGRRPFGGSAQQMIRDHLATPPPRFIEKNPQNVVPEAVENVVMRCLSKEPQGRPRSALGLIEEFQDAVAGRANPTSIRSPSLATLAPRPQRNAAPSLLLTQADSSQSPASRRRLPRGTFFGVLALMAMFVGLWAITQTSRRGPGFAKIIGAVPPPDMTPAYHLSVDARRQVKLWRREGFEPVVASGSDRGWPMRIRRMDDGAAMAPTFRFFSSGHYLPEGYEPSGDARAEDGWPATIVRKSDGASFRRIAGGRFVMGSQDEADSESRLPHEVRLSGFYLQETEVTNAEMDRFAKSLPIHDLPAGWVSRARDREKAGPPEGIARHPAMAISHADAERFARSYAGGALPTEAQWEFAARSRASDIAPYIWSANASDEIRNKKPEQARDLSHVGGPSDGPIPTVPVGSFPRTDVTRQGILDLGGNLREWCRDVWGPYQVVQPAPLDPCNFQRRPEGNLFVVRGAGYATMDFTNLKITSRDKARGDVEASDLGFRVVIETPESPGASWKSP